MTKLNAILTMQIAGFVAALVALAVHAKPAWFVIAFMIHFVGDIWFVEAEGLPKVSFLDQFESMVKIAPWLQFVGYMLALLGMVFSGHFYSRPVAFVGIGISFAGYLYKKIYP